MPPARFWRPADMQCQTCGLNLDPQQVAQTGRCPRCGTPVQTGTFGGVPAGGSGSYPQAPTYGQSPTVSGPPPQGTFSTIPPQPSQPGFSGPPPQGFDGPPQQGWGAPPQGFAGPPPQPTFGGPPPQGFGAPPPGGQYTPPRKSKTGLIVIISVIVLVVLVGGAVGAIALLGKKSPGSTGSSATNTPTGPTSVPTASVPAGFSQFSNTDFSIDYPSDWMKSASTGQGAGVAFGSQSGQQVFVVASLGNSPIPSDTFVSEECSATKGTATSGPSPITIGGQQWSGLECTSSDGASIAEFEGIYYKGQLYFITYTSPAASFMSDQTQYYLPMQQTFRFLV